MAQTDTGLPLTRVNINVHRCLSGMVLMLAIIRETFLDTCNHFRGLQYTVQKQLIQTNSTLAEKIPNHLVFNISFILL